MLFCGFVKLCSRYRRVTAAVRYSGLNVVQLIAMNGNLLAVGMLWFTVKWMSGMFSCSTVSLTIR